MILSKWFRFGIVVSIAGTCFLGCTDSAPTDMSLETRHDAKALLEEVQSTVALNKRL